MQKSEIPAIAHHLLAVEYASQHLTTPKVQAMPPQEQIAQLFEAYKRAYDNIKQMQLIPPNAK